MCSCKMDGKNVVIRRLRSLDALRQAQASLRRQLDSVPNHACNGRRCTLLRRKLGQVRRQVEAMENALQVLDPEERLLADWLFIYPQKGNVQKLCQTLCVEQSTVYRKRERILKKLVTAMFGG